MDFVLEIMILKMILIQVKILFLNGWNVILDNCNVKLDYIKQLVSDFLEMVNIDFKLFDLLLEEFLV